MTLPLFKKTPILYAISVKVASPFVSRGTLDLNVLPSSEVASDDRLDGKRD